MEMFKEGVDQGYQEHADWWYRLGPHQFRIANLDEDYPEHYFKVAGVPEEVTEAYCKYVVQYFKIFSGRDLNPPPYRGIIEIGCGGGWFLQKFIDMGINIDAIEGSAGGFRTCELKGLDFIAKTDIREVRHPMIHKYDMALASEILEHVEPCFHGIAVYNLCGMSDLVWFSSEDPTIVRNQSHLHHPGEFPLAYWQALFNWHNYGCLMLPDYVYEATAGRGRCIFYNKATYQL